MYCFEACDFYLNTRTRCEEKAKIPVLINSDSASTYVTSSCIHLRQGAAIRYVFAIRDADVVTAISSGQIIGFAMPLEGGDFKVVGFSLDGALAATRKAVDGMKARPKVRDTGLRDRTL